MKKPKKVKRKPAKRKRVDKRAMDQIEADGRELGHKFKSGSPLVKKD